MNRCSKLLVQVFLCVSVSRRPSTGQCEPRSPSGSPQTQRQSEAPPGPDPSPAPNRNRQTVCACRRYRGGTLLHRSVAAVDGWDFLVTGSFSPLMQIRGVELEPCSYSPGQRSRKQTSDLNKISNNKRSGTIHQRADLSNSKHLGQKHYLLAFPHQKCHKLVTKERWGGGGGLLLILDLCEPLGGGGTGAVLSVVSDVHLLGSRCGLRCFLFPT